MTNRDIIEQVTGIHDKISELLGGQWGISWSYGTIAATINNNTVLFVTLKYQFNGKNICTDVYGENVIDALTNFHKLFSHSIENFNTAKTTPVEVWTPSEHDFSEMDKFFENNPLLYTKTFASQLFQGVPKPYKELDSNDRARLCGKWKIYLKAIGHV